MKEEEEEDNDDNMKDIISYNPIILDFEAILKKIHEIMKIYSCNIYFVYINVNMNDLYYWIIFIEISISILTHRKEDALILIILDDLGMLLCFMKESKTTFHAFDNTIPTETIMLDIYMTLTSIYKLCQICTIVLSFWRSEY